MYQIRDIRNIAESFVSSVEKQLIAEKINTFTDMDFLIKGLELWLNNEKYKQDLDNIFNSFVSVMEEDNDLRKMKEQICQDKNMTEDMLYKKAFMIFLLAVAERISMPEMVMDLFLNNIKQKINKNNN